MITGCFEQGKGKLFIHKLWPENRKGCSTSSHAKCKDVKYILLVYVDERWKLLKHIDMSPGNILLRMNTTVSQ